MGIDFNSFKDSFLSAMKNAANFETIDNIVNTNKEIAEAKNVQSTFKGMIQADSIGDMFTKTTNDKTKDEVSVQDLLSLIDDPDLDIAKVNKFIEEKPVETLANMNKVGTTKQPENIKEMTDISDADKSGVKFYTDNAIANGRDKEIGKSTEASEEGMSLMGAKFYDAFMEALYA